MQSRISKAIVWMCVILGIALPGAMQPARTFAASINVGCDVTELVNAINTANADADADTLALAQECAYTLTTADNTDATYGDNGLPVITNDLTIHGNNASIVGISNDPQGGFNLMQINGGATVNLDHVTLTLGNGAIRNLGALTVTDSTLSGNRNIYKRGLAIANEGDLVVVRTTFSENWGEVGGAIDNLDSLQVIHSRFIRHKSNWGGAIFNSGSAEIQTSTVKNNSATVRGGAIENSYSSLLVTTTTFARNHAGRGGAIYNQNGNVTLGNSTLFANRADFAGGGIFNPGALLAVNITLANQRTAQGANIHNAAGKLTFQNSILQSAVGMNCRVSGGKIVNGKRNLDADGSCGVGPATNPLLDPKGLQENGGHTRTIKLLNNSPAVDKGKDSVCSIAPINGMDQRGITRPQGAHCDIGAYELEK